MQIQKWVHEFAEDDPPGRRGVGQEGGDPWPSSRRPPRTGSTAGTCWPSLRRPHRPDHPLVMEELFWGDAGIGLSIFGTGLGVAGIMANGTPEQIGTGSRSASAPPRR